MTLVSFAQNFEDVMLARALRGIERGFYIDVGAQDPEQWSVTKAFYDKGWRGINIEPARHWFEKLSAQRVHDTNVGVAASDKPGRLQFFDIRDTGLSTANEDYAARHAEAGFEVDQQEVPCMTLDQICAEHAVGTVHFLKIDCEGSEKSVLQGFSLDRVRPWIILVEATEPLSETPSFVQWEPLVSGRGYHFVYDDGLNRFYVADERAELDAAFSHPPNVFDDFLRVSELTARERLHAAESALHATHDAARIVQAEAEQRLAKLREEFLDGENERREVALVEHRRLLEEAAQREVRLLEASQSEAERWRSHLEYLHAENERREAALVEHRQQLAQAGEREAERVASVQAEATRWQELAQYLHAENERREAALVEHRQMLEQAGDREAAHVASVRAEVTRWQELAEYMQAENERRETALVSLREALDAAAGEVDALKRDRMETQSQVESLAVENGRMEQLLDASTAQITGLEQALAASYEGLAEAAEKIAGLSKNKHNWNAELAACRERLEAALKENHALQAEVGRLHREVDFRNRELARLNEVVKEFLRSTSWRITYPIRASRRALGGSGQVTRLLGYHLLRWPVRLVRPVWRQIARWPWISRWALKTFGEQSRITRHTRLFLGSGSTPPGQGREPMTESEVAPLLGWQAGRVYQQIRTMSQSDKDSGKPPRSNGG